MIRRPAVAGQFYSSSPSALSREVDRYTDADARRERAIGVLSPHAGLMYSGRVAGAVYSRIEPPHTFVLLGPNHTGVGKPVSIMSSGRWQIPTGEVEIDRDLSERLLEQSKDLSEDTLAHSMEHSLEVQLPFILHFATDIKIVPIVFMVDSLEVCRSVGVVIAEVIKGVGYPVTIVASSDMTHYENDSVARKKDQKAIDMILSLDPEGLYRTVKHNSISMCGYIPAVTMLYAVNELGAREAVLVKYMTSGEVSGDYGYVVGYAGVIIK
jgi:hypothetical protein